jgi:hypothetical protein
LDIIDKSQISRTIITPGECDTLRKYFFELNGIKNLMADIPTNHPMIKEAQEKCILAHTMYSLTWEVILENHGLIGSRQTCDFSTREVEVW